MESGKDVRGQIRTLQAELGKVRAEYEKKATPFYEKKRPLSKALSYLDKEAIPKALEQVTGQKVIPRFELSEHVLKAIAPKEKGKRKK